MAGWFISFERFRFFLGLLNFIFLLIKGTLHNLQKKILRSNGSAIPDCLDAAVILCQSNSRFRQNIGTWIYAQGISSLPNFGRKIHNIKLLYRPNTVFQYHSAALFE